MPSFVRYSHSNRVVQKDQGTAVQGGIETKAANPVPRAQTGDVEGKVHRNTLTRGRAPKFYGEDNVQNLPHGIG